MTISKLDKNLNIIQELSDRPNALEGLSAAELKNRFDEAGNIIKDYINNVLLVELQATTSGASGADKIGAGNIVDLEGLNLQSLLESLRNKLKSTEDGTSGADFVSATTIEGLNGGTVQTLLEALKMYVDEKDTGVGKNFVSKSELSGTRKLSASGDFTGSWFGVTNPAKSDPGIQGLVELHTVQLAETAKQSSVIELEQNKANKTEVNELASGKADTTFVIDLVESIPSGTPEAFANLAAITAAYPTGNAYVKLNLEDGYTYKWNSTAWVQAFQYIGSPLASGSVTKDKISKKSVTESKTTFAKEIIVSANLFNKETLTLNHILSTVDGSLVVNASYDTSDYIDVTPSESYYLNTASRVAEYANGFFVKHTIASAGVFITQSTTTQIRISLTKANVISFNINKGSSAIIDTFFSKPKIDLYHEYVKSLISNGNFSNGITGWSVTAGVVYTVNNNTLTITEISSSAAEVYRTVGNVFVGHKYYISEEMKSNSASDSFYFTNPVTTLNHSGGNEFERLSAIVEATATSIGLRALNSSRSGSISANPVHIRNVQVIDLTAAFGPGKEPTLEDFESMLQLINTEEFVTNMPAEILTLENLYNYTKRRTTVDNSHVRWIAMGDSITEGALEYPHRANEKLKFSLTNSGYGGASMAMRSNENESFNPYSFVYKAKNIDWTQYDLVTIFYGTNDWSNSVPLGVVNGTDEYTYLGALNVGLQAIYTQNPTINVVLITPTFRRNTLANTNSLGLYLADYVTALKGTVERFRVPVIDLWLESGWNYYTCESYTYDGLHPNTAGQIRLGNIVAGRLAAT